MRLALRRTRRLSLNCPLDAWLFVVVAIYVWSRVQANRSFKL